MEVLFLLSMISLIAFMVLATYDGVYLHIWKYELFNKKESVFEHTIHTIRAILFPLIVWLIFINVSYTGFLIGIGLVVLDFIVLGIDAYSEEESRSFMNGLPKWEYIIHLFANGFHFSAILFMMAAKIEIVSGTIIYATNFLTYKSFEIVKLICVNIVPGAIILAFVHLFLASNLGRTIWNRNRIKIACC